MEKTQFLELILSLAGKSTFIDPLNPHDDPFIDKSLPGTAHLRGDGDEQKKWVEAAYLLVENEQITLAY